MKIAVTQSVVERMLIKSKRIFKSSNIFSEQIKEMAVELDIIILFNDMLSVTAGRATTLDNCDLKYEFKYNAKKNNRKSYLINHRRQYLVIEVNRIYAKTREPYDLFDTVSHEYAHCIDFMIRGNENRKNSSYHDYFWQILHRSAGGSGQPTYF